MNEELIELVDEHDELINRLIASKIENKIDRIDLKLFMITLLILHRMMSK